MAELILDRDGECKAIAFTIHTDKQDRTYVVPAWPFRHAGFEEFTFVVHKSIQSDDYWIASERTTGMLFATAPTIDQALEMASIRLEKAGIEKVRAGVQKGKRILAERGILV